ncbi:YesL family protein [Sediminibacillus massiliensis]|uniref:YesL family protein n=1 Tax=Sediminibacillus massiliensis TaxID=1926277 RepID=UPI000988829E|nr:YesL family protein [Sediminibacillus massiliensis]
MEWITRIAYVNLLWTFFSLAGLIVFGIGPATTAMYAITRKWVTGRSDIKILPLFWKSYRSEFLRSNALFWLLMGAGYILYIDYQYLANFEGALYIILLIVFINITLLYILVVLYIFPVFVHFQHRIIDYFKHAFLVGVANPLSTLSMLICLLVLALLMERVPGLIPFFPAGLLSLLLMWFSYRAFSKMER